MVYLKHKRKGEQRCNDTVPLKELIKMVYDAYNETESNRKSI